MNLQQRHSLFSLLALGTALALFSSGCEKQGPLEEAGETADEAVEDVGEAVEEAGDSLAETLDGGG